MGRAFDDDGGVEGKMMVCKTETSRSGVMGPAGFNVDVRNLAWRAEDGAVMSCFVTLG